MKRKSAILLGVGAVALLAATAGASAYVTTVMSEDAPKAQTQSAEKVNWSQSASAQPQARAVPACDDDNIVGKVVGGVAGGVVGSQFGKGNGKTATTIGGTVGGTLLGEEYMPTRNVTCR